MSAQDFTGADLLAAITRWHKTGSALDVPQVPTARRSLDEYSPSLWRPEPRRELIEDTWPTLQLPPAEDLTYTRRTLGQQRWQS